ncbi:hypothetical protein [Achromobacter sp. UMC46]|uniref:hypothetical protein n=1 Tax=Achromobacter sp. UMC46 TaxID=1862319 RepID=UPI0015FF9B35|nr:hypothetical protein [Achromobacter sp. UMC46]MBB1595226.1 hypothetical protein [Achromobacter sp. UMC46]
MTARAHHAATPPLPSAPLSRRNALLLLGVVVLAHTMPLWVIPGAWLFLREPIGRARQMGLLGVPVFGLLCLAVILDEPLGVLLLVGMALIVGGIAAGVFERRA